MTKPMMRIHNTETNEIIDREMNEQELAVYVAEQQLFEQIKLEENKVKEEKAALLTKLGITADEAALLLG